MTRFHGGPADGVSLLIRRAPPFLRVVRAPSGSEYEWDALDRLHDKPAPTEEVFVYRRRGEPSNVHLCRRPRGTGGWFQMANYDFHDPQPSAGVVRDRVHWRSWATRTAGFLDDKPAPYVVGFAAAEADAVAGNPFRNPFDPGTEQHKGYEVGQYTFTAI